ncbi:MAG: transporter substrate-binding domain-containing protein [Nitrospirae bacterium]|nr:transporter substrate-binding domain-containing protein [Nitrospirota bacterium]MBF0533982.1 transporter substrate-binding domain-containing protein [Nitrospirota bacterium]MBF0616141.1 transporter substrate-binding domain-containing protein [Nitrospirota bacterium]
MMRFNSCIAICLLLGSIAFVQNVSSEIHSDNRTIELTSEERAFLQTIKQVRLGVDSARQPFEFITEKGVYSGISAGFIKFCARRLGISIVLVPDLNVGAAMKKLNDGEIDVIPKISPNPQRANTILFTKPYATFASVIVTRQNVRYISGVDNLEGLRVGVLKGLIVESSMKHDYPALPLISLPDVRTALLELSSGNIDVYIDNMAMVSYNIDRLGLNNLKIAAQTPYVYDMAFGVRKDWPLLASALDKTLAGMSKQERAEITGRWLTVEYRSGVNWRIFGPILVALIVIIAFVAVWNRRLRAAVSKREAVQQQLKEYALELESRSMIKFQVSQISSALQKTVTYEELAQQFLSNAAPLIGAAYGILYVYDKNDKKLRAAGGYGCAAKNESFDIGQGLVGQCAFEKEPITITAPSGSDIVINWGIGKTSPGEIILMPVTQTSVVLGVMELATITAFNADATALIDELVPIVAVNIEILNRNLNTEHLLEETQQLADKLNSQQRMLQETEIWYRGIIESAPDGIMVVNQSGEIILTNFMADKIFGYEHGELIGKTVEVLVPRALAQSHLSKRDSFFKNKVTRQMGEGVHITGVRKDGTEFPVDLGLSQLSADGIRDVCACATIRDITVAKRAEEELRQRTDDLERFSRLTIDREERMIELKEEVNTLLEQMNKGSKYKIVPLETITML